MSSARFAAMCFLGLSICLGAATGSCCAQSISTASKSAEISAFGAYMAASTDYGPRTYKGYSAGADFTLFTRFVVAPSLEVRGGIASGSDVTEKTVVLGPRVQIEVRQRFHPYADFLFGGGEIRYHPLPYADYTGDRSRVYSYGGGINIDVTRHFGAKFDFQQQDWNLGKNSGLVGQGTYTLAPRTLLVGVIYTIPFRTLNRQGDFR